MEQHCVFLLCLSRICSGFARSRNEQHLLSDLRGLLQEFHEHLTEVKLVESLV